MKRYAEIFDGKVVHIGSHDITPVFSPDSGLTVIELTGSDVKEGWLYDGANFTAPPEIAVLPVATITTYAAPPESEDPVSIENQTHFSVGEMLLFRVQIPGVTARTILVAVDRLDAEGDILEKSAAWIRLEFEDGLAQGAAIFDRSGRYGVGPHTSSEFVVPEHSITIIAQ